MIHMNVENKKFTIISPQHVLKVAPEERDSSDGALYIRGIANSGISDRVNDVVTREALESIAVQALNRNLHLEHGREIEDIIGTITGAVVTDEGLEVEARIRENHRGMVQALLDDQIKLGLSIAGYVSYEDTIGEETNIVEWDLTEISLVAIPCDARTMGTVTSKSFASILAGLGVDSEDTVNTFIEDDENMAEDVITRDEIIDLINTAFNEKQLEFLEQIRKELREEYDVALNALSERVDAIENKLEEEPVDKPATEEEVDEVEVVEESITAEEIDPEEDDGDGVPASKEEPEEEEEEVVEDEEEPTSDEPAKEDEEEEDAPAGKSMEQTIKETVTQTIHELFTKRQPEFNYNPETKSTNETDDEIVESKKGYTPEQLAKKIILGDD